MGNFCGPLDLNNGEKVLLVSVVLIEFVAEGWFRVFRAISQSPKFTQWLAGLNQ